MVGHGKEERTSKAGRVFVYASVLFKNGNLASGKGKAGGTQRRSALTRGWGQRKSRLSRDTGDFEVVMKLP